MNNTHRADLASDAWLLRGLSSIPGTLVLSSGRLRFTASGTGSAWHSQLQKLERDAARPRLALKLEAGEEAVVFDLPTHDADVAFPWYYFSGGLKLRTSGATWRLSFGKPAQAHAAGSDLGEVQAMRAQGKAWREALRAQVVQWRHAP